jgi:hypothetical protein
MQNIQKYFFWGINVLALLAIGTLCLTLPFQEIKTIPPAFSFALIYVWSCVAFSLVGISSDAYIKENENVLNNPLLRASGWGIIALTGTFFVWELADLIKTIQVLPDSYVYKNLIGPSNSQRAKMIFSVLSAINSILYIGAISTIIENKVEDWWNKPFYVFFRKTKTILWLLFIFIVLITIVIYTTENELITEWCNLPLSFLTIHLLWKYLSYVFTNRGYKYLNWLLFVTLILITYSQIYACFRSSANENDIFDKIQSIIGNAWHTMMVVITFAWAFSWKDYLKAEALKVANKKLGEANEKLVSKEELEKKNLELQANKRQLELREDALIKLLKTSAAEKMIEKCYSTLYNLGIGKKRFYVFRKSGSIFGAKYYFEEGEKKNSRFLFGIPESGKMEDVEMNSRVIGMWAFLKDEILEFSTIEAQTDFVTKNALNLTQVGRMPMDLYEIFIPMKNKKGEKVGVLSVKQNEILGEKEKLFVKEVANIIGEILDEIGDSQEPREFIQNIIALDNIKDLHFNESVSPPLQYSYLFAFLGLQETKDKTHLFPDLVNIKGLYTENASANNLCKAINEKSLSLLAVFIAATAAFEHKKSELQTQNPFADALNFYLLAQKDATFIRYGKLFPQKNKAEKELAPEAFEAVYDLFHALSFDKEDSSFSNIQSVAILPNKAHQWQVKFQFKEKNDALQLAQKLQSIQNEHLPISGNTSTAFMRVMGFFAEAFCFSFEEELGSLTLAFCLKK